MIFVRKLPKSFCINCKKETARSRYKFCSNFCQRELDHKLFINDWKEGKITGLNNLGLVSNDIKRYLRRKYNNKCLLCGWAEINPKTGTVPLVADHIDGNWRNNKEDNLRLVCPNCDSLLPTYGALNKGNGRKNRKRTLRKL